MNYSEALEFDAYDSSAHEREAELRQWDSFERMARPEQPVIDDSYFAGLAGCTDICTIGEFSVGLTPRNQIYVKLPNAGRRYPMTGSHLGRFVHSTYCSSNGGIVQFEKPLPYGMDLPIEVVDKLENLLQRQTQARVCALRDSFCEPPRDCLVEIEEAA